MLFIVLTAHSCIDEAQSLLMVPSRPLLFSGLTILLRFLNEMALHVILFRYLPCPLPCYSKPDDRAS